MSRERGAVMRPGVALMVAALLAGVAPPVWAVEPVIGQPVPDEPTGSGFPDRPVAEALAVDLDGDGIRELLAVIGREDALGLAAIQAFWIDDAGVARGSNVEPLRRSASVDELLSGRGRLGIDSDDMIAVRLDEPAQFLVVQREGRDVPLVATIGTNPEFQVPCCLTIWEIALEGGEVDLRLVASTQRLAEELVAADMDADGTDELVVAEGQTDPDSGATRLSLLRWNGARYARTPIEFPFHRGCCDHVMDAGDSDGAPGEEVLLVNEAGSDAFGLYRVSLRGGVPEVERAETGGISAARAVRVNSGPVIVTVAGFSTLTVWSWPRDGVAERLAIRTTGATLGAVFGEGEDARVFMTSGSTPGSVVVAPADLGVIGSEPTRTFGRDTRLGTFQAAVAAVAAVSDVPFEEAGDPFFGVFPGGVPGSPDAYVFAGHMVQPVAGGELATSSAIALLPGLEPMGTVGPAGTWTALLSNFQAYLQDLPASPAVIHLPFARPAGTLRLAATEAILTPEVGSGHVSPTFHGVAADPLRPALLTVGNEAVDAVVEAPIGTVVGWSTRSENGSLTIGPEGAARIRLLEPAGPNAPDGSGTTTTIWLVTPAGHAYAGTWRIAVYRQPPDLGITDAAPLFDLDPTVDGQTLPGATVTINGEPVRVAADGSFAAAVEVGILPTELRVVATDPVGNQTTRVISRVWPFDYRQLPFVLIAVILTLTAAALLFLRRPDTGPRRGQTEDGATFEEIGG